MSQRTERIVANVDRDTLVRIERKRTEFERRTGVKPSVSAMAAMLLNQALGGQQSAA